MEKQKTGTMRVGPVVGVPLTDEDRKLLDTYMTARGTNNAAQAVREILRTGGPAAIEAVLKEQKQ